MSPDSDLLDPSSSSSSVSSILTRRIRFAPLPDPRALDNDNDNDSDVADSVHSDFSKPVEALIPVPNSRPSSLCSYDLSDRPTSCSAKPTAQQLLSHPPTAHPPTWSRPKSLNLFRPFPFKRSSSPSTGSLTPTPSLDCPTPTNVPRTSSKQNETASGWGLGLTRWTSAGSHNKIGAPLARTQSTQSYTSSSKEKKDKRRIASIVASFASSPSPAAIPPLKNGRKGIRMLNGRVYGASKNRHKSPNANPFANIRDDGLEFVEWGYGGMGSVRGGRHAGVIGGDGDEKNKPRTRWERLHSQAGVGAVNERKTSGEFDDGDDDGSGMAWLKRRREQREKKEQEQQEKAHNEKACNSTLQQEPSDPPIDSGIGTPPDTSLTDPDPQTVTLSPVFTDTSSSKVELPAPPEHNLTAVSLPAQFSRHRRIQSRSLSSEGGAPTISSFASLVPSATGPTSAPLAISKRPSFSESEYDSDSEESADKCGDEDDEDEDEDEDEQDEIQSKTALGAGVEKISRHN